jgi:cephalosporin hydroxylase
VRGDILTIDAAAGVVTVSGEGGVRTYELGTPEAFALISRAWLRAGWDAKYVYSFTWLGRPIIQLPEDLLRIQELIFGVKPDVIIETGVAHGGSLVFYASLCKAMGRGRAIGVDIDIRPHNRAAIEGHALSPLITLVEGDSLAPTTVHRVKELVRPDERAMVMLDSCHEKEHVLAELRLYAELVTPGSYIVAMDGIMQELVGAPRSRPDWDWNNPRRAAEEFLAENRDFVAEEPPFAFNEGSVSERVTYWPGGFLRRVR